ncbi:MAG: hypothetical protein IPO29_11315 [Anaerolineae bacterium]|nr:hypothetical protein [Anaerolineae bacterium]
MTFLLEAFVLGNSAILTNVCMLPLYPGLIAFLAGTNASGKSRPSVWLGVLVLAGVLTTMLLIGAVFPPCVNRSRPSCRSCFRSSTVWSFCWAF